MDAGKYPYAIFEGNIVPIEDAKISIMTNALHYGVGIFGGIKSYETNDGPAIFRLDDHLKRLSDSVKTLGFNFVFNDQQIKNQMLELARKNDLSGTTYIRPIIYRSDTRLSPDIAGDYSLAVYMLKVEKYFDATAGVKAYISKWVRNSDQSIPPRTKATGGYINSALAIDEAHKAGFDSAIMLDKDGFVSEGAVMNLFLAKNGELITPSLDSDILEGITRRTIIELAQENNINVIERKVKKQELFDADEVFFTGTAAGVTWCNQIDEHKISNSSGPISSKLAEQFVNLYDNHPEHFTLINQK